MCLCIFFHKRCPLHDFLLQATVETATYGSEFVASRTAKEQIMDIRQTLSYQGVPIGSKSFLSTLHFTELGKPLLQEPMAFNWIQSAYNLSDMLSNHWDHPTVYPIILKQHKNKKKKILTQPGTVKKKDKQK